MDPARPVTPHYASFDGMTWPRANEAVAELEWQMRYGNPESVRFLVASVIGAYLEIVHCPRTKREAVIRRLRETERCAIVSP